MTMRDSIAAARTGGPSPQADGATSFEFRFGANDPTFAGHFPARPLLPGVFQLEMARLAAEWFLDCPLTVGEICKAKFLRPILPGETVRMDLKLSEAGGTIQARAAFSVAGERAGETVLRLWRSG
jgi:3-hydroxymyristoyl/3-hydroxydecanoyl-(acyl carrier protein) dehydratase